MKKSAFFVTFIFSKGIFLAFVLSQYIEYWINFQITYAFTYQKTLLHRLSLLVFKTVESI